MLIFMEGLAYWGKTKINSLYAILEFQDTKKASVKNTGKKVEIKERMVIVKPPKKVNIAKGKSTIIQVEARVASGYHIQANPAGKFLIPTTLSINSNNNWSVGSPIYPKAKLFRMKVSKKDIPVYDGDFVINVSLKPAPSISLGDHNLEGKLTYQACNEVTCFFEESIKVKILVNVFKEENKKENKVK